MQHHRLDLRHRGAEHVHVWAPRCACGWTGRYKRRRRQAVHEWMQHANSATDGLRRRRTVMHRGVPTAQKDLPEELRAC